MTDKTIENERVVGGNHFKLVYARRSKLKLQDYLLLFDFNDYWCYKTTRHFRQVDYESFLRFDYSSYTFFRKDLYKKEHIESWIKFITSLGGIQFLDKPTPPFPPENIIIRK
jgi:hypothetical protein